MRTAQSRRLPALWGILALACTLLANARPARAMTAEEAGAVEQGMGALFRSDYDGAQRLFREALEKHPGHAAYSLGYATSVWWRMENNFALPDSPEEKTFVAAVKQAIHDAKRARDESGQAQDHLHLAAAYGLRGRWRASRRRWLSAYLDGRRAYRNAKEALKLDPALYDAYLGIGAFDYYVAGLSGIVQALAFTSGGDKTEGLAKLRLAAERGRFGRVAAKLLLVGIHWTLEKKPQEAWRILEELHGQYPDSPLMDSMRLLGLFHLRDSTRLKAEARSYLEKAQRGAPFFQPIDRPVGRCFLGLAAQLSGENAEALKEYEVALNDVPPNHRWRSVLRLFMGEALDLLDRREDAETAYKLALKEPPLWGVHRYARHLLRRPFRSGDNPLPARDSGL